MRPPARRRPDSFQVGKHAYVVMRIEDLDDLIGRKVRLNLSLHDPTKADIEREAQYSGLFKKRSKPLNLQNRN